MKPKQKYHNERNIVIRYQNMEQEQLQPWYLGSSSSKRREAWSSLREMKVCLIASTKVSVIKLFFFADTFKYSKLFLSANFYLINHLPRPYCSYVHGSSYPSLLINRICSPPELPPKACSSVRSPFSTLCGCAQAPAMTPCRWDRTPPIHNRYCGSVCRGWIGWYYRLHHPTRW